MEALTGTPALAMAAATVPGLAGYAFSRLLGLEARVARKLSAASAGLALLLALATGALYVLGSAAESTWLRIELPGGLALALGARVDGLTVAMLVTVTLIGAAVARYAERYLDGDPGQARFSQWLSYTLSAVLLVIVSSNLAMFFVGWIGTSHGLHRLLTFWSERPAALLAARKKFLISRIGDAMLLLAFALVARRFGSLEFSEIFARVGSASEGELLPIALLLVLGAMTKSAQFPFHTWLPDSMETPTPVSALMHAGIINAGGFLLIRMSPLLGEAPTSLVPLALGGAFTALLGSVAILAQTDVKRKYAWSTVAQMGFMMLQCGLGAFAAAALHMVGHAFYKGHAFLAAGSVVDPSVAAPSARVGGRVHGPLAIALALAAGFAVVALVGPLAGVDAASKPGLPVLGSVLALAIAQMLLTEGSAARRSLRTLTGAIGIGAAFAAAYFAGVAAFGSLLGPAIPSALPATAPGIGLISLVLIALFVVAFGVQHGLAPNASSRLARAAYVHARDGFYLGTIQNRIVERIWPISVSGRIQP